MQTITLLGATGSIGDSTLDVVARHPERYRIFALTAQSQVAKLIDCCRRFRPQHAVIADPSRLDELATGLKEAGLATEALAGPAALEQIAAAPEVDMVMAAIVGAAGLRPSLAAVKAGKKLLLANKEALVLSGELFMRAARSHGATLLPIDSEHNAVFQSLPANYRRDPLQTGVRRILLTASGGPFRNTPLEALAAITPEQACAHPNWVMGRKISVDSATMMNKGLEVIEAHWLFGVPLQQIEVVVHPQSIVHSLVEYIDGSVLAQLGNPDMRTPIAHALAYPERIASGVDGLQLAQIGRLDFEAPDLQRFPCLKLAYTALGEGSSAPAFLNAANEEAVAAFLDHRLGFTGIADVVSSVLERLPAMPVDSLDAVLAADEMARLTARDEIARRA